MGKNAAARRAAAAAARAAHGMPAGRARARVAPTRVRRQTNVLRTRSAKLGEYTAVLL